MTKRKIEYWVIPPEQDAEFVAAMEDVLEIYAKAYDPHRPVLCMDEKPFQLLKETQVPTTQRLRCDGALAWIPIAPPEPNKTWPEAGEFGRSGINSTMAEC